MVRLFYKVRPDEYMNCMKQIREKFAMHEEIDEARTTLMLEDQSQIERVSGTFDPSSDEVAQIRVVLNDELLKEFFDSVLGEPYLVK
jgi:hypothetical protein